jgi:hypothetical protein
MDNIRIQYNGSLKAVKYIMNGHDELCDYKVISITMKLILMAIRNI